MHPNQLLYNRLVDHQVDVSRLGNGVAKRLIGELNRIELTFRERLTGAIETQRTAFYTQRLEAVIAGIAEQRDRLLAQVQRQLDSELIEFADVAAEFEADALARATPPGVSPIVVSADIIIASTFSEPFEGVLLRDDIAAFTGAERRRMMQALRAGFVAGTPTPAIVRELLGATRKPNPRLRHQLRTIATTAIAHMSNTARRRTYAANADIIREYRHLSTLDSRTSRICMALSGTVYRELDAVRWPPLHRRCRSAILPTVLPPDTLDPDAPPEWQAAETGPVDANLNYSDWLRAHKSPAQQRDILGDNIYAAWRDGKLPLKELVDRVTLRPLTVAELRARGKL